MDNRGPRLLLSYIFDSHTLKDTRVIPNFTYAFEFLMNWMPKVNKIFEPMKNPAKSEAFRDVSVKTSDKTLVESLEPQKHFRTSKNPYPKPRFAYSTAESQLLLRIVDNVRTIFEQSEECIYIPDFPQGQI